MRIQNVLQLVAAALLSVMMVACKSTDDMAESPDSSGQSSMPANNSSADTSTADPYNGLTRQQFEEQQAALATTVFYFEFDKSDLNAEARAALVHHANNLKANPSKRIRLEGHADERGTREYNLALGERRAQAVERYLQVQGVSARQMETISYGEERPADPGTTEAAYSRNRRVEMK